MRENYNQIKINSLSGMFLSTNDKKKQTFFITKFIWIAVFGHSTLSEIKYKDNVDKMLSSTYQVFFSNLSKYLFLYLILVIF